MFVVPRSNLLFEYTREVTKPAFYILAGEDESTKPQAYIGETENFKEQKTTIAKNRFGKKHSYLYRKTPI